MLTWYNRPGITLNTEGGRARFHEAVRASGAELVLLDSILAAFPGEDLNDNPTVRALFSQSFGPLTSDGIAVQALHHKRKSPSGGKLRDDDRGAMLGAQDWGAAAGRIYALERLANDQKRPDTTFRCRLSLVGSWTPEEAQDLIIQVGDTAEGGTSVCVLEEDEQIRQGGVTAAQRAAVALARVVRVRRRVARKVAFAEVGEDLDVRDGTLKKALSYAKVKQWIEAESSDRGRNAQDLVPGPLLEDFDGQ